MKACEVVFSLTKDARPASSASVHSCASTSSTYVTPPRHSGYVRAAFATYRLAQHPSNGVPLLDAGAEAILAKAVMSGADGMGHSDGVVAAAAALALLPEKVQAEKKEYEHH